MTEVRITRTLPAPAERVWRALTNPVALAAWFWPARYEATVELDLREGGAYRIDGPGAGMAVSGRYLEVTPTTRLAFTWQWDGDAEETVVTVELTPSGDGTELLLVHGGFAGDQDRDNHAKGWSDCLDRLPAHL